MRNHNLTFITQAITAAGGTIPSSITTAEQNAAKITAHLRDNDTSNGGYTALADAWANAIVNDRDPAEDREVLRALLSNAIAAGDIGYAAINTIEARAIEQLRTETQPILAAFKTAFDQAGEALTRAHDILGDINLDDSSTIAQLGPAAMTAYQTAKDARALTRTIDTGWIALAELTGFAPADDRVLRWAEVDLATWEQNRQTKDAWQLTADVPLSLAIDRATLTSRAENIARERDERTTAGTTHSRAQRREQGAVTLAMVADAQKAHAND